MDKKRKLHLFLVSLMVVSLFAVTLFSLSLTMHQSYHLLHPEEPHHCETCDFLQEVATAMMRTITTAVTFSPVMLIPTVLFVLVATGGRVCPPISLVDQKIRCNN